MKRIVVTVLIIVATQLDAHHSVPVNFDMEKTVTINGVLVSTRWVNPHSHLVLTVPLENGATERWLVEWNGINTIRRMAPKLGFSIEDFVVGETISVTGWLGRHDKTVFLQEVSFADGDHFKWNTRPSD